MWTTLSTGSTPYSLVVRRYCMIDIDGTHLPPVSPLVRWVHAVSLADVDGVVEKQTMRPSNSPSTPILIGQDTYCATSGSDAGYTKVSSSVVQDITVLTASHPPHIRHVFLAYAGPLRVP